MLEDADRITTGVDGWLAPQEGPLLHRLAAGCQGRGAIVEIGSWKGKSTIWLAMGARASGTGAKVLAVDPHTGSEEHQREGQRVWTFDEFRVNIRDAGVEDRVEPVLKTSVDAAAAFDGPVELLWIDGAHDYDSVAADIAAWAPKLVEGGIIAFHDSRWPGVRRAIEQYIYRGSQWCDIQRLASITWARKVAGASSGQRIRNVVSLHARHAYDAAYERRDRIPLPMKAVGKRVLRALDSSCSE